jgi:hypothetical protein
VRPPEVRSSRSRSRSISDAARDTPGRGPAFGSPLAGLRIAQIGSWSPIANAPCSASPFTPWQRAKAREPAAGRHEPNRPPGQLAADDWRADLAAVLGGRRPPDCRARAAAADAPSPRNRKRRTSVRTARRPNRALRELHDLGLRRPDARILRRTGALIARARVRSCFRFATARLRRRANRRRTARPRGPRASRPAWPARSGGTRGPIGPQEPIGPPGATGPPGDAGPQGVKSRGVV